MSSEKEPRWLALKLAVIVLAAGGAAFFALRSDNEWKQSDAPETGAPFICLKDGHGFQVTPAKFEAMTRSGDAQERGGHDGEGGLLALRCPKCREMTAVPAKSCEKDNTMFPARLADGKAGRCPQCGWSFYR